MQKKNTLLLLFAAALVLIIAGILFIVFHSAVPSGGSFEIEESDELAILRYQAEKGDVDLTDASESEIRDAVNGRLSRIFCIYTGGIARFLSQNMTVEKIASETAQYYYCHFDRIKIVDSYDSRITWTEESYYCAVSGEGEAYIVEMYPEWTTFYAYAVSPSKVLPPFTQVRAVYCMDEYQGMNGTYIFYDTSDGGWVLYWANSTTYLVPLAKLRTACIDAYAAHEQFFAENGFVTGTPTPWEYLEEYRRDDLVPAEVPKEDTEEPAEEENPRNWVSICIAEVVIGAILFTLVMLLKRRLRRREEGCFEESENAQPNVPEETAAAEPSKIE